MSNLRWLEREGKMVLQIWDAVQWEDVETVKEPRKAREFWMRRMDNSQFNAEISDANYDKPDNKLGWFKVSEVLPDDK